VVTVYKIGNDPAALIDGLPRSHHVHTERRPIAWDEPKHILSSVWVWYTVTHGDHIYAPPRRPDPQAPRPKIETSSRRSLLTRWPHLCGHRGICQQLRECLIPYAESLATQIDVGQP
jgi:hypothetical protein